MFEKYPYIKNRFFADFNGRRGLRIWVGEMAQSEVELLEIYTYLSFINYLMFLYYWCLVLYKSMDNYGFIIIM